MAAGVVFLLPPPPVAHPALGALPVLGAAGAGAAEGCADLRARPRPRPRPRPLHPLSPDDASASPAQSAAFPSRRSPRIPERDLVDVADRWIRMMRLGHAAHAGLPPALGSSAALPDPVRAAAATEARLAELARRAGEAARLEALLERPLAVAGALYAPGVPVPCGELREDEACCVCLEGYARDGPAARRLRCAHVFHSECIGAWLAAHTTCPCCRGEAVAVPLPAGAWWVRREPLGGVGP